MKNKQVKNWLYLTFLSALIGSFGPREHSAQESKVGTSFQSAGHQLRPSASRNFVTYKAADGVSSRRMTEQEERSFHPDERAASGQIITEDVAAHSAVPSQDEVAWQIILRGTQQLETQPEAKAAFLRVAAKLESVIRSKPFSPGETFIVYVDVDFGSAWFGTPYQSPGPVGATSIGLDGIVAVWPFSEMFSRKALGGSQQQAIFQALPFPIKTEFGETVALRWTDPVTLSLFSSRLENQPRFAIGFNSAIRFDFDQSNGIDADKVDFETLVTRELLRVFGFVSEVGARELRPAPLASALGPLTAVPSVVDLYRFRPGVTMETFTTAPRVLRAGGEQVFFTGDLELPLSTARPDGTGGDGRTADHWKDDELTGQYLGIMDPTYAPGERGGLSANDLTALSYFSFRIRPDAQVMEVLSVDDNSREQTLPPSTTLYVNRFTPPRAPFNVESVRVQLPNDGSSPAGKALRVVVFADANRTGQPPANPQFFVERTITIAAVPENRMLEVLLPTPVAVTGGDLYVGVQAPNANLSFAADSSAPRNRSFISSNNGTSFQPLPANGAAANAILRAVVNAKFNALTNRPPEITALSPNAAPSGSRFKLTVFGRNLFPDAIDAAGVAYKSIIRLNGRDKATEFLSPSQLRTELTADLTGLSTARITVFTMTPSGGFESAPLEMTVTNDAPVPVLTQLDQSVMAVGLSTVRLTITGRNFTASSVARFNAVNRQTRFINSTKLEVTLTASDLAIAANAEISVFTPAPGGGASNALPLRIAPCTYRLAPTMSQRVGATRSPNNGDFNLHGVLLETEDHCPWTVQASASWIVPTDPSGMGRAPIGYNVVNNPGGTARTGTITVGGQTLTITQVGMPTVVSSASYERETAPESIATLFGTELAKTTQVANTLPLPTNLGGTTVTIQRFFRATPRPVQLFFVSPTQINLLVSPTEAGEPMMPDGESNFISVFVDGQLVADGYIRVRPAAPALFSADSSGKGLAAAVVLRVKTDGTQVYEPVGVYDRTQGKFVPVPIDLGPEGERVFLILFGTGIRGGGNAVLVSVNNQTVPVTFVGPQGSLAGLDQLNVELPHSLRGRGEVPIFCIADIGSNEVTVQIK